ncbi:MAG: pseudouridine synthase [Planctomycetota bacterium]
MSSSQGAARPPLVRYLSRCHVAPRPEARRLVQAGRVTVNGRRVTDGAWRVDPARDRVEVDGQVVRLDAARARHVWWVVNKPRGTVATTRDPEGRPTVLELVPEPRAPGLAPVGRLDKASAGLLLLTNDHEAAARLLDPASHVAKVYRVKVRGHPGETTLAAWRTETVEEDGLVLGPMDVVVERVGPKSCWLSITLHEGKNRQIRRRVEAAGHAVEVLVRTRFGPLELGDLAPGAARELTPEERAALLGTGDPDTAPHDRA